MKKIVIALLLVPAAFSSFAQTDPDQNNRKQGFIGISLGPSFAVGKFSETKGLEKGAGAGAHINLINFGYRFTDNIGITAKWYGGSNIVTLNEKNYASANLDSKAEDYEPWTYGGIMVGPLVSVPIAQKIELDFRPMMGYCITRSPKDKIERLTLDRQLTSQAAFAYSLGANLQFNVHRRIGLHIGADFFHSKADFSDFGFKYTKNISAITSSFGVAYRFN